MIPDLLRRAAGANKVEIDPYFSSVSLLLHMEGTNASTSFVDSGPNALAVTASGNAQISTTQSKFGGAAGSFDGTNSYITATNSVLNVSSGDFTIEFWINFGNVNSGQQPISIYSGTSLCLAFYTLSSGTLNYYLSSTGSSWNIASGVSVGSVSANTWYHVALVRSGSTFTPYLNGVAGTTTTSASNLNSQSAFYAGVSPNTSSGWFTGKIDDLRITKGVARYTSNFTPRAKAFPDIYNPYKTPPTSGAALWLAGDDSSTLFTDAGVTPVKVNGDLVYQWNDKSGNSRNATQTTSGNRPTWVPPASGRNGLGAVSFNGTNNYIDRSAGAATQFSGDFTIECWIKLNAAATQSIFDTRVSETSPYGNGFVIASNTSNQFLFYQGANRITSTAVTTGQWNHLAVCRSGSSIRMFLNGTQTGSTYTSSTNYSDGGFLLGTDYPRNARWFNGVIQNLLIYNNQALYTANFTPWMS